MPKEALAPLDPFLVPEIIARRGGTLAVYHALRNLYPGARDESIAMVLDYCKAKNYDPLLHAVHLVPMRIGDSWRDVVIPGIALYRIIAHRTGEYLGHTLPEYGPVVQFLNLNVPEWCQITVKRWNVRACHAIEFPVRVLFAEVVTLADRGSRVNERWSRAPVQMLTKCAEAAALRAAFPEELGSEPSFEEVNPDAQIDTPVEPPVTPPVRRSEKKKLRMSLATDQELIDVVEPVAPEPVSVNLPAEGSSPPNAAAPRSSGSGGTVCSERNLVITDTQVVTPKDEEPFWEVRARIAAEGRAPVAFVFLTRTDDVYQLAADAEGSESRFTASWMNGTRRDGSKCKVLTDLQPE